MVTRLDLKELIDLLIEVEAEGAIYVDIEEDVEDNTLHIYAIYPKDPDEDDDLPPTDPETPTPTPTSAHTPTPSSITLNQRVI
jgi:hypothetical protein